jgi:transcription antitermination factor NusG
LLRIRSAPGIAYVLPRGGLPTIVPDTVIDVVRARLAECPSGIRAPELHHGERVRIIDGPFRSLEAVFDRRLSADGRVRLLLEFAQRTVHINVEKSLLKRV